ncbi:MAG: hypothetical protein ACI8RZ_004141 [Myxococcota bacterium]|jgi:hypothetical protein
MMVLLLACVGAPQDALTWREGVELLGVIGGQGVIDARITVGNTGTLRGQARMRVDRWSAQGDPILFSQHAAPQQVIRTADGITMMEDGLSLVDGLWGLRVVDETLNGRIEVQPAGEHRPETAWLEDERQWTVAAEVPMGRLSGWLSAGERGGAVRGVGVVLHRGGDGVPALPRTAAFVLDERVNIGIDRHGAGVLRWAIIDGQSVPVDDLTVDLSAAHPTLTLPSANLQITLHPWRWDGWSNPMDHLMGIEALLGGVVLGRPMRRVRAARAEIVLRGESLSGPAILLDVMPASQVP